MANTLKEFEKLLHLALDSKVTLHRKLMMYLLCLILAALGILLLLLTAIGGPLKAEPQIAQVMENQLKSRRKWRLTPDTACSFPENWDGT